MIAVMIPAAAWTQKKSITTVKYATEPVNTCFAQSATLKASSKTMSDSEIIKHLVAAIKEASLIPENHRLWTKAHIASYVNKSEDVVDRMTNVPDFPDAIRIKTCAGKMHPQWKAVEVIAWVEKQQERRKRK